MAKEPTLISEDLHDKKITNPDAETSQTSTGYNPDNLPIDQQGPEENPGDGLLAGQESAKEARDALPVAPPVTLSPSGQRARQVLSRLRNHVAVMDIDVLDGEVPETQLQRNQVQGLRKVVVDAINEGLGEIQSDSVSLTVTFDLGNDEDYVDPILNPAKREKDARDASGETLQDEIDKKTGIDHKKKK